MIQYVIIANPDLIEDKIYNVENLSYFHSSSDSVQESLLTLNETILEIKNPLYLAKVDILDKNFGMALTSGYHGEPVRFSFKVIDIISKVSTK